MVLPEEEVIESGYTAKQTDKQVRTTRFLKVGTRNMERSIIILIKYLDKMLQASWSIYRGELYRV